MVTVLHPGQLIAQTTALGHAFGWGVGLILIAQEMFENPSFIVNIAGSIDTIEGFVSCKSKF